MSKNKDISKMTTGQIVDEYNKLSGKHIKKFADRKTAVTKLKNARVLAASDAKLASKRDAAPKKTKRTAIAKKKTTGAKRVSRPRIAVMVGKKKYGSVQKAFTELGIPITGVIHRIRRELHADGSAKLDKFTFKLVK